MAWILFVVLAATLLVVSKAMRCEDDGECSNTMYCYTATHRCVPCVVCSEYKRKEKEFCVKEPLQCGDCLDGYEQEILSDGIRNLCIQSSFPEPQIMTAQMSWQTWVFGLCGFSLIACALLTFFKCKDVVHVKYRSRFFPETGIEKVHLCGCSSYLIVIIRLRGRERSVMITEVWPTLCNDGMDRGQVPSRSRVAECTAGHGSYMLNMNPQFHHPVHCINHQHLPNHRLVVDLMFCMESEKMIPSVREGYRYEKQNENMQKASKFRSPNYVSNSPDDELTPPPPNIGGGQDNVDGPGPPAVPPQEFLIDEDTLPSEWSPGPDYPSTSSASTAPLVTSFSGILLNEARSSSDAGSGSQHSSANHSAESSNSRENVNQMNVTNMTNITIINSGNANSAGVYNITKT
ncbi:Ribose-5-phosphate isomerase A [Frankliniella fusca]|uniref:Ribose-5-phosphate isomerase A n=1 Tax=Frankliniella fusca TaxID=407009 RepID=A0AAE1LKZ7_9NEOP|nr:Ribose-5-phosphate isomerase A [Frankliniella fusca]